MVIGMAGSLVRRLDGPAHQGFGGLGLVSGQMHAGLAMANHAVHGRLMLLIMLTTVVTGTRRGMRPDLDRLYAPFHWLSRPEYRPGQGIIFYPVQFNDVLFCCHLFASLYHFAFLPCLYNQFHITFI